MVHAGRQRALKFYIIDNTGLKVNANRKVCQINRFSDESGQMKTVFAFELRQFLSLVPKSSR